MGGDVVITQRNQYVQTTWVVSHILRPSFGSLEVT